MSRLFGKDRLCAVVAAATADEMLRQLRAAFELTHTIELRLDYLRNELERMKFLPVLESFLDRRLTLIATCRRRQAGGLYRGKPAEEWVWLSFAAGFGCKWCDIEIETVSQCPPDLRRLGLEQSRRIISWHCFAGTPNARFLKRLLRGMEKARFEAVKIATQCHSIADSLRVLALARGRRNVVAVPMGEMALPARVLALRHGSALAYGAVVEKTAPGQLTLDEMKSLYRADQLNRRTRVYGVIGDPIAHSLSPVLHNAGFQARKINAVYLPFLVRDIRDFFAAIRPLGITGFSVTLPHKQAILRYLDDCDPLARAIGAVNTVVVRGGGSLYGYNTDYVGVLRALERRVRLRGSRVLLYGAGGAARAVAFALAQAGAIVNVAARRIAKARELARAVGGEAIPRVQLRREFFDAILNATPVGMHPHADRSPLEPGELNCRMVMDLIYRPRKTRLLELAERRGIDTVSGVEMFLAQGTAQWEIWTGLRAPEKAMRRAVLAALGRGARRKGRDALPAGWGSSL